MGDGLPFSVPARHARTLKALVKLDDSQFGKIIDSLKSAGDSLSSVTDIQMAFEAGSVLGRGVARRAVLAVIGLYVLHTSHNWELRQIVDQASKSKELELADAEQSVLAERLNQLLASTDLQLVAKAVDIVGEQANNFHRSRVITDMRPVFSDAGEEAVDAAVITQTLIINYFDDGGQKRSLFVSLGEDHIRKLQHDLARAELKADAIRRLCASGSVRIIDGKPTTGEM